MYEIIMRDKCNYCSASDQSTGSDFSQMTIVLCTANQTLSHFCTFVWQLMCRHLRMNACHSVCVVQCVSLVLAKLCTHSTS